MGVVVVVVVVVVAKPGRKIVEQGSLSTKPYQCNFLEIFVCELTYKFSRISPSACGSPEHVCGARDQVPRARHCYLYIDFHRMSKKRSRRRD